MDGQSSTSPIERNRAKCPQAWVQGLSSLCAPETFWVKTRSPSTHFHSSTEALAIGLILAPRKSSRCDSVEFGSIKALSVEAMLLVMLQAAMSYILNGLLGFVQEHLSTIVISAIVTFAMVFLAKLFGADSKLNDDLDDSTDKERPPRPKWEVLSVLNWVVLTVFVVSITFTVVNYRKYFSRAEISGNSSHNILPMLCIWCVCMAYFYGFFGISFLDKSVMSPHDDYGMPGYVPPRGTDMEPPAGVRKGSHHHIASPVKPTQHQMLQRRPQASPMTQHHQRPISDGLICAERTVRASKASAFTAPVSRTPATAALSAPPPSSSSAFTLQNKGTLDFTTMTDEEILTGLAAATIKDHELEKRLKDCARAVRIRRAVLEGRLNRCIEGLPCEMYDYNKIMGVNCEIVIGYVPVPVGVVGPLLLDGKLVYVPMATTEGCLVASTNRGCKAITEAGGAHAVLLKDGMTRAPLIRMPTASQAAEVKRFVEGAEGFHQVKEAFESTTSFGKLKIVTSTVAGRNVFLRFVCHTGDAMGMNMISKGCLRVMELLEARFPDMELLSISGNMCTDKKPAAVNWIEGRGKSVVAEAFIPDSIVRKVLKTTVGAVVDVNKQKNLVGSAMAGSVGGFNAHAANVVAAVFLATGQDIAQVVESANCITLLEEVNGGEMLHVSVTMPSIEVGTVGGGTHLEAQGACLDIVGVRGASKAPKVPGENAQQLAKVIAAAVMAGELSLLAALAANHLVKAHMDHNRKPSNASTHKPPITPPPSPACAQLPGPLQSGDEAVRSGGGGSCIASE